MGGYAWVTLATNNSYSLGALVLAHSLKKANTAHKLVVLITPAVSQPMREQLQTVFDLVKVVDVLDSKDEAHLALMKRPDLGITFTKIHCWRLVEFEKCVFLDADTLVVRNCDELFEKEEFSAAPDVSWPDCFNSGVFVYRPSIDTFNKILQFAVENRSFDGGDQGLLNQFFSDWATEDIKKHLPFVYNLTSVAAYSYIPAFKHYGSETRIVHFIGTGKPWLQQLDVTTRTVTPSPGSEHLAPLLQQWWDLFCEKVHPNLDKSLESSNDGMSHPPVEAYFLPVALTDEPQTGLLSEPCTPYREKDDFRQHNLPYLPFHVKGPSGELLNVEFLLASVVPPAESEEKTDEQQRHGHVTEDRNDPGQQQEVELKKENEKDDADADDDNNNSPNQDSHICVEHYETKEPEKESEEKQFEGEQKEEQQQQEQQQEEPPPPPPPPKDPFDYYTFFPDETCISSYLEKNVVTYQPFDDHHHKPNTTKPEPEQSGPSLPRFLTIPQNDQRQSGNMNTQPEEEHQHHHQHQYPQQHQHHHQHQYPQQQQHENHHQHQYPQQHQHEHHHQHQYPQQHQDHHQHQYPQQHKHEHHHQHQYPQQHQHEHQPAREPARDPPTDQPQREGTPPTEERQPEPVAEKRELSKSKSMSCFPCDVTTTGTPPRRSIWKSQPDLNVDPNRRYSMPRLKPILPKQRSFSKSVPSAIPKVTLYTEFLISSEYKDPVDLPKDKVGFVETHIHKLRRTKSDADITDKFGPLPYSPSPVMEKPSTPKRIPLRHFDNEYYDLTQCKRQMGNKPKPKDAEKKKKETVHTLPALKPIVPGKGKKSSLVKKRKSKELSPGDGGREKILKRESKKARERKRESLITPRNVSTNGSANNLDEILERLRGFSKDYQHFFGAGARPLGKTVTCKNATVQASGQDGHCGSSEAFETFSTPVSTRSAETQTPKKAPVENSEFRQFRNYIKDRKETSQKGLLSIQDILSGSKDEDILKVSSPVNRGTKQDLNAEHSRQEYSNLENSRGENEESNDTNTTVESTKCEAKVDNSSTDGSSLPPDSRLVKSVESKTEIGIETSTHSKEQSELRSYNGVLHGEQSENPGDVTQNSNENGESVPESGSVATVKESVEKSEQPEDQSSEGEISTDHTDPTEEASESNSKEVVAEVPEIDVKFSEVVCGLQQKDVERLNGTTDSGEEQEKGTGNAIPGIQENDVEGLNSTRDNGKEQEKHIGNTVPGIQEKDVDHLNSAADNGKEQGKDSEEQNEKTPPEAVSIDTSKTLKSSDEETTVAPDPATAHKTQNGHVTPQETGLPKLKERPGEGEPQEEDKITPQVQSVVPQNVKPQKAKRGAEKWRKPEEILCVPDFDTPRTSRVCLPSLAPASKPTTEEMTNANGGKPLRLPEQLAEFEKSHEKGVENGETNGLSNDSPDGAVRTVGKRRVEGKLVSPRTPSTPFNGNPQSESFEESKTPSGIAGAIAQLSLDAAGEQTLQSAASTAQQEYLRRQNWETGNMDYMGRDSFDNIWSKICQTLEAKELEENAAGSSQSPTETSKAEERGTGPAESPVSLSEILHKCPEYMETLPGEPAAGPVEDDEIIFSKPENRQSCLTNIAEEEEAGAKGSAAVEPGTVKLSDILGPGPAAPVSGPAPAPVTTPPGAAVSVPAPATPPVTVPALSSATSAPVLTPALAPASIPPSIAGSAPASVVVPDSAPVLTSAPASVPASPTGKIPASVSASAPVPSSAPPSIPASPTRTTSAPAAALPPVPSSAPASIPASPTGTTPAPVPASSPVPTLVPAPVPSSAPASSPASPTGSAPVTTVACIPVTPPASTPSSTPSSVQTPAPADETKEADKIVEDKTEVKAEPGTPSGGEQDKKSQEPSKPEPGLAPDSEKAAQPEREKTECKTVALIPQAQSDGEKKAGATPQQTEECKTVAIPSPPIVLPGAPTQDKDKRRSKMAVERPQVQSEPIPLPPPSPSASAPSSPPQDPTPIKTTRSDSLKDEGKQKKGVFTKILEMVGVAPKEKNGAESKSVFYDVDDGNKSAQNAEKQSPGGRESEKPSDGEGPAEVKQSVPEKAEESQTKQEESKMAVEVTKTKTKDETAAPPANQQKPGQPPFPKPARGSSPKLTIPAKPPETEITMPTPPPQPDVPPRRNSALLKVDETILQTPPVPEPPRDTDESVKGKMTTEIEEIIGKAKSEVESLLQERRSAEKETGEGSDLINTMKLLMGAEQPQGKPQQEEVEELRVTSEEERRRHKGEAVTSKLSDQILKAIPPPRRKAISEASASTNAIPKPSEAKSAAGESSKPKPAKPSAIPVPPPRNRGKPTQPPAPAPSKAKGKK